MSEVDAPSDYPYSIPSEVKVDWRPIHQWRFNFEHTQFSFSDWSNFSDDQWNEFSKHMSVIMSCVNFGSSSPQFAVEFKSLIEKIKSSSCWEAIESGAWALVLHDEVSWSERANRAERLLRATENPLVYLNSEEKNADDLLQHLLHFSDRHQASVDWLIHHHPKIIESFVNKKPALNPLKRIGQLTFLHAERLLNSSLSFWCQEGFDSALCANTIKDLLGFCPLSSIEPSGMRLIERALRKGISDPISAVHQHVLDDCLLTFAYRGDANAVKLLLGTGANPNVVMQEGLHPLTTQHTARLKHKSCLEVAELCLFPKASNTDVGGVILHLLNFGANPHGGPRPGGTTFYTPKHPHAVQRREEIALAKSADEIRQSVESAPKPIGKAKPRRV